MGYTNTLLPYNGKNACKALYFNGYSHLETIR